MMVNIVLTHTFRGFINNFCHLISESLPVVHHYLRVCNLLSSPEKIQFYCDTKLPDILSLYSSLPVRSVREAPQDAVFLSERSRFLGILPLPYRLYGPTKSLRKTLYADEVRFLKQQAIDRFSIPPATSSILLIKRMGARKLNSEGLLERLQKIAPTQEVDLAPLSFREQVTLTSQSRCIVAAHGAALSHMVFMQTGGVVEICPSRYVIDYLEEQAKLVGREYHLIEGENPLQTDKTNLRDPETRKKLRDVPVITCDSKKIAAAVEQIFAAQP